MSERKQLLLRVDPAVHEALGRWAAAELRSTTAHIEYLLRQALALAGRLPENIGRLPRRGRPPKPEAEAGSAGVTEPADADADADADEDETEAGPETGASEAGNDR